MPIMIKMKRILLLVIMAAVFMFCAYSQSMTLIMIQNDSTTGEVRDITRLMENAILDDFFEAGYIISNEPVLTGGKNDAYTERLTSAGLGNVSYIIPVTINYNEELYKNEGNLYKTVKSVDWEIILGDSFNIAAKGSEVPNESMNKNTRDIEKGIARFSGDIVSSIEESVRKLN